MLEAGSGPQGALQYQVRMDPVPGSPNWTLTIHLAKDNPALSTVPGAPVTGEVTPEPLTQFTLTYLLKGTTALRQLDFDAATAEPQGYKIVLTIGGDNPLALRDEVKTALTEQDLNTVLLIRRSFDLGIPVPPPAAPPGTPGASTASPPPPPPGGMPAHGPFGGPFGPGGPHGGFGPHFPPGGLGGFPPHPVGPPPPTTTPVGTQQYYRRQSCGIDFKLPLYFDKDDHAYIFSSVTGSAGSGPALIRRYSNYKGFNYPYFQPSASPDILFYLPDSFKIARRGPTAPHYPCLTLSLTGATQADAQVTLRYVASPVISSDRLAAALADPSLAQFSSAKLNPQPLPAPAKLRLALPETDAGAGPFEDRTGAHVDLASGIDDAVTRPLAQFQQIFTSIVTKGGSYLQGQVAVNPDGGGDIQIPFIAQADDFIGDLFDENYAVQNGVLVATLTNACEALIHVGDLSGQVTLLNNGNPVDCRVMSSTPAAPCDLKAATDSTAAEQIQILVAPVQGNADENCTIQIDDDATTITVDQDALLGCIVDQTVAGQLSRTVTIKLPANVFAALPPPQKYLMAVQLSFDDGTDAGVDSSTPVVGGFLSKDVQLPIPAMDFITQKAQSGQYRYKRQLIFSDGSQQNDSDWRTDSRDWLIVPLDPGDSN